MNVDQLLFFVFFAVFAHSTTILQPKRRIIIVTSNNCYANKLQAMLSFGKVLARSAVKRNGRFLGTAAVQNDQLLNLTFVDEEVLHNDNYSEYFQPFM
jgi:ferredoxin